MDLADASAYGRLKDYIALQDDEQLVVYLSVPPSAAADIVDFLGEAGLNTSNVKIMFEKPFGFDVSTAKEYVARTRRYYEEDQIYRIDHYMAKEIAAEIIRLRRDVEGRHHSWDATSVKKISVVASEAIGIEGRAQFYEQTGALRDFIQGHLMQLLSLALIMRPGTTDLPQERLKVLQSLRPADPDKAVRGQYAGYQEEVENIGSTVETFVSLSLESQTPEWKGAELQLITGKALSEKRSYIKVEYHDGTEDVFEEGKVLPTGSRALDAYERVLRNAIVGDKDIFTTSDEVIRAWEIVAPVQERWAMDTTEIPKYQKGMDLKRYI
jgi:glucose-6-phosphate 1-dehydrogenase